MLISLQKKLKSCFFQPEEFFSVNVEKGMIIRLTSETKKQNCRKLSLIEQTGFETQFVQRV